MEKQCAGGTAAISHFYIVSYDSIQMRTLIVEKETRYMKNMELLYKEEQIEFRKK